MKNEESLIMENESGEYVMITDEKGKEHPFEVVLTVFNIHRQRFFSKFYGLGGRRVLFRRSGKNPSVKFSETPLRLW